MEQFLSIEPEAMLLRNQQERLQRLLAKVLTNAVHLSALQAQLSEVLLQMLIEPDTKQPQHGLEPILVR